MILKKKIVLEDLESVDAELYRGLKWMLFVPLPFPLPTPFSLSFLVLFNSETDEGFVLASFFS
jgi:hypothetical protein